MGRGQKDVVAALRAADSETLRAVARETGFGARTLWRYRNGESPIPASKVIPIGRALGVR